MRNWPTILIVVLAVFGGIGLIEIHNLTYDGALQRLVREAHISAQSQVSVLQSELDKQRSAPVILADDSDVAEALRHPSDSHFAAISRKLEKLQTETKSAVIYILNRDGHAVSASNWALPTSFVGSQYGFRDYFRDALVTGTAEQFALGTVSRHPGLYLSHRIGAADASLGVVVVKVEFDTMEQAWSRSSDRIFVTDGNNNIVLTSDPAWRFKTGPAPTPTQILTSTPAPVAGWQLHLLGSRRAAENEARSTTLIAAMSETLIVILIVALWRRQKSIGERAAAETLYREKLELNVALRTRELSDEIRERQQAEKRLNILQADLVQANKLASLGQITAGVAHEINQPLATIRVLAESALSALAKPKLKNPGEIVAANLGEIGRMSERIGHITGELRTFSRKATGETEPVSLKETVESSILLNRSRLRDNRVRLIRESIDPKLTVMAGRIRLEQVLVNLLQNAFEALEDRPSPEVRLNLTCDDDWVILTVADNGPGLKPEVFDNLFTPFVTTKAKGLGLGLVIASDILRDFGGELLAENADAGAVFKLKLRRVK